MKKDWLDISFVKDKKKLPIHYNEFYGFEKNLQNL